MTGSPIVIVPAITFNEEFWSGTYQGVSERLELAYLFFLEDIHQSKTETVKPFYPTNTFPQEFSGSGCACL
jgi:hypothetical protein